MIRSLTALLYLLANPQELKRPITLMDSDGTELCTRESKRLKEILVSLKRDVSDNTVVCLTRLIQSQHTQNNNKDP
jgi:hypothetical protein